MMTFIILAPYGTFTTLMLVTSAAVSMFAAAAICLMAIGYDVWRGRSIKILGAGSALLFVALGCYYGLVDSSWSNSALKLAVDIGVLTIALASLAIRQPFTLQYAREIVGPEAMKSPVLRRVNYVITWAWTVACLLMATGNLLMIYVPGMPFWAGIAIGTAARFAALYFTAWYRRRHPTAVHAAQLPLSVSPGA